MELESSPPSVRFGRCVVDVQRRLLWRDGVPVALTAKTFDVLAFLIQHPHRLINKEEFFEHLWPGTYVLEASLVRQISLLRKALGQRTETHDYIVTIPGRGYEFVATVERLDELPGELAHAELPQALASAADRPIDESSTRALPPPRSVAGMQAVWAMGLAFAVGLAITVFLWGRQEAREEQSVARTLRQVTFEPGSQREPSWSPDGAMLAFTSDAAGNGDVWVQPIGESAPRRLTLDAARDSQPSWSPDGKWIVFRSERDGGGIYKVDVEGGADQKIASFGFHPRWSSTGRWILFSGPSVRTGPREVYVVEARGGTPQRVATEVIAELIAGTTALGWLNSVNVSWHPDGERISILGQLPDGSWRFVTVPVSGGEPVVSAIPPDIAERLIREKLHLGRFSWAPSGRYLYFEGRTESTHNIWRVVVEPETLAWVDQLERLTTGTASETDIAVSADGSRIAFSARTARTRVWEMKFDPHTNRLIGSGKALTSGNATELDLDASPDGRKLAYRTRRAGRTEVWELDTTSRAERLLVTSVDWRPMTPRWSSDGRRLAYIRPKPGTGDDVVALLSTDAGDEELVRLPDGSRLVPTDWSEDGTTLFGFCRLTPTGSMAVCSVKLESRAPEATVELLAHDASKNLWVPRLSPDGQWVAFVAVDVAGGSASRLYVVPVRGGPWSAITDGRSFDDKPRWSPDGRTIYFISSRDGWLNVWGRRFDPDTGRAVGDSFQVTSFAGQERTLASEMSRLEFGVTEDRLFLPLTDTLANIWVLDQADQ